MIRSGSPAHKVSGRRMRSSSPSRRKTSPLISKGQLGNFTKLFALLSPDRVSQSPPLIPETTPTTDCVVSSKDENIDEAASRGESSSASSPTHVAAHVVIGTGVSSHSAGQHSCDETATSIISMASVLSGSSVPTVSARTASNGINPEANEKYALCSQFSASGLSTSSRSSSFDRAQCPAALGRFYEPEESQTPFTTPTSSLSRSAASVPKLGSALTSASSHWSAHGPHLSHNAFAEHATHPRQDVFRPSCHVRESESQCAGVSRLKRELANNFVEQIIQDFRVHDSTVEGIQAANNLHVFIDWSNISISLWETLKHKRRLLPYRRLHAPIRFDRLAHILVRNRRVAVGELAGSRKADGVSSRYFEDIKRLGFNTSILCRVQRPSDPFLHLADGSSSSESDRRSSPAKMGEQCVDEILQLKMSESMIEGIKKSSKGTIVLATGDANEAEFSKGFLSKVEDALELGWFVELYSFKHHTSKAWLRKAFQTKWENKFSIHFLDEYAERLVDDD